MLHSCGEDFYIHINIIVYNIPYYICLCIIIKALEKNWKDTHQIGAGRSQKNQECVLVGISG